MRSYFRIIQARSGLSLIIFSKNQFLTPREVTMKIISYQKILAWLGLIPFIVFSFTYFFISANGLLKPQFLHYFTVYGAIILTFLSGIHWGVQLKNEIKLKINLYILSNVIALLAFLILAIRLELLQLIFLLFGFSAILLVDLSLYLKGCYTKSYISLRVSITVSVLLLILLCLLIRAFIA